MNVLLTGATGFIGRRLAKKLVEKGHRVAVVSRDAERARHSMPVPCEAWDWNAGHEPFPQDALEGVGGVVNLAGENIGQGRWTAEKKKKIYDSRILVTRQLAEALQSLPEQRRPEVFISGSAIGIYGDRGDEVLEENSPPGADFLAKVCVDWENASRGAPQNVRTIQLRTGLVLDRREGALSQMLPPFKLGLGAVLGAGSQWMSWIHIDDLSRLVVWLLENAKVSGPVNAVSPHPVSNKDFSKLLGAALSRPVGLRAPALALKLILGEKARLLLASQRVRPQKILDAGFNFLLSQLNIEEMKKILKS